MTSPKEALGRKEWSQKEMLEILVMARQEGREEVLELAIRTFNNMTTTSDFYDKELLKAYEERFGESEVMR